MSSTFSRLAAGALVSALNEQPVAGRHLVANLPGDELLETFSEVLERSTTNRTFSAGPGAAPVELRVVNGDDGCVIIPYLVQDPPPTPLRDNRGTRGFVSALRDHYLESTDSHERLMLLVFDSSPVETLLTTMDEGVVESALGLENLLMLALTPSAHAPQGLLRALNALRGIATEKGSPISPSLTSEDVGRAAQACQSLAELKTNGDVADQLHSLPWCLRDPTLFEQEPESFEKHIRDAIQWRRELETWASTPTDDFDAEVRGAFSDATADKVRASRRGTDIDWSKFTLDEITAGTVPAPTDDKTPSFGPSPLRITEAIDEKLLTSASGRTLAARTLGPGCTLDFELTKELTGTETLHLLGYEGQGPPFKRKELGAVGAGEGTTIKLSDVPEPRDGWSFLEAVITKGKVYKKRFEDKITIALQIDADAAGAFVYENNGDVDVELQAYAGNEILTFIVKPSGEQPSSHEVDTPEEEYGDLIEIDWGAGCVSVPAVQGESELSDSDRANPTTASPEHFAVESWAQGVIPPGELVTSLRRLAQHKVVADVGAISRPVDDGTGMTKDRWKLEEYAIENPETTAFHIDEAYEISSDEDLSELPLDHLLQGPFEAFIAARKALFEDLSKASVPSVLSLNPTNIPAAEAYVNAYRDVLSVIPNDEPSQPGYDRILMVDAFTVKSTGEVLIAPTSPLSVAAHLELQRQARGWLASEPAPNYFGNDIDFVSAQNQVPYLLRQSPSDEWLESSYAPYPWRRYLPASMRVQRQRHPTLPRYIKQRIERFISVHPSYADDRRTIRLAFVNPGKASHVLAALLSLVEANLDRPGGEAPELPRFELELLSNAGVDETLGADLDSFMVLSPEDGERTSSELELMKRLSYTKGTTSEFLYSPKAFAHVAFVEDYYEPRRELVERDTNAHPSSFYLGGLAADTERLATRGAGVTNFFTSTWTGGDDESNLHAIASRTSEIAAAAGVPVKRGVARATQVIVPDTQVALLYDKAIWVVHIDKYLGIELFSPHDGDGGSPYILDYTDQETPNSGIFDGITATRNVAPYNSKIRHLLEKELDRVVSTEAAERLLQTLNLVSGRWGLEMLETGPDELRARLATALAVQVIEQSEGLQTDPGALNLVIALDELLRVTGAVGLPLSDGWAQKAGMKGGGCDDLLVLTVPLASGRPQLRGRIIEVKYRTTMDSTSAKVAAEQIKKTHERLEKILVSESEPGRQFQGRRLAKLILQYTGRHVAYGLHSDRPAVTAATEPISRIASGDYDLTLEISRDGRQLCGDYVSVEPTRVNGSLDPQYVTEEGIEIGRIRIGQPIIDAMLGEGVLPEIAQPTPAADETKPVADLPASTPDSGQQSTASTATPPEPLSDQPQPDNEAADPQGDGDAIAATVADEAHPNATDHVSVLPKLADATAAAFALPEQEIRDLASRLDDTLMDYNLPLQPVDPSEAVCGPSTIQFRVRMARGGTIARVEAREQDLTRQLAVDGGKQVMIGQEGGFVTIDIPRAEPQTVRFRDLLPTLLKWPRTRGQLPVMFGVDGAGETRIEDLAALPHLLVAGSTGSGKSVFLSSLIGSLATLPQEQLELVLIDVKGLDFARFGDLPHLRQPVIDNAEEALAVLEELYATEREKRKALLIAAGTNNIVDYYRVVGETDLKQIVIVIDEFANLLSGDKETSSKVEDTIEQYAEIMRSFGIYMVIATQRPTTDIVTGRIKANLPARCAFRLPTTVDSITILGRKGAEQLLGNGDMLYYRDGQTERLQAPLTVAEDVLAVIHSP